MPRKRASSARPAAGRRVCFVTGTRAEFGLMESTLRVITRTRSLQLQLIVTGVHTHRSRGNTVEEVRQHWPIDRIIPWKDSSDASVIARETGRVSAELVSAFDELNPDIVMVVGDRVEAFAAASAAHLGGRVVAHVHGGDRALGQTDDAVRHAITKLSHLHFAATPGSAARLFKLGEQRSRIFTVGAPGIDGIHRQAISRTAMKREGLGLSPGSYAVFLLHPTDADVNCERSRCEMLLDQAHRAGLDAIVALLPNNDPGAEGIRQTLLENQARGRIRLLEHAPRGLFLGLLRDCRLLLGNSSAGIIEAGSFNTPVVDVGSRQAGRERGKNVFGAAWSAGTIARAIGRAVAFDRRQPANNPYGSADAGRKIAAVLASHPLDETLRRKVIRY